MDDMGKKVYLYTVPGVWRIQNDSLRNLEEGFDGLML